MSHFSVLVIGEDIERQLAPFDERLRHDFVDCTEEIQKDFAEGTCENWSPDNWNCGTGLLLSEEQYNELKTKKLINLDEYFDAMNSCYIENGNKLRISRFDDFEAVYAMVSNVSTPLNSKIKATLTLIDPPEDVPLKETYGSFEKVATEYHEYEYDETHKAYGYYENSKAKWDWYQIGGRWAGYFAIYGNGKSGYVSRCKKKDIDVSGMKAEARAKAFERYDRLSRLYGGSVPKLDYLWAELLKDEKLLRKDRLDKYHGQPAIQRLKELKNRRGEFSKEDRDFITWVDLDEYQCSREEYGQRFADSALSTFAVLKDGEWYARGKMGWWGCVSNKKNVDEWNKEFNKLFESLPDDTLLTIVDCHI